MIATTSRMGGWDYRSYYIRALRARYLQVKAPASLPQQEALHTFNRRRHSTGWSPEDNCDSYSAIANLAARSRTAAG